MVKKFIVCRKMNSRFILNSIKPQITYNNEYMIVAKDTKLLIYNINTGFCVSKCRVDFSLKTKTGYVKGFSLYGDGQKIIAGYKKGYVVVWDINNILEPVIENFFTYGQEIDDIIINSESKHALIVNKTIKTVKCLDVLNNFAPVSEVTCDELEYMIGNATCSDDSKYFAFITKKSIHAIDLELKEEKEFRVKVPLSCIKMKSDGKYLCVGDTIGKIHYYYNLFSSNGPTISSRHWHANKVNVLEFTKDNAFLLSGGKEAVVVLWHQITQQNSFISRVGNHIINISTSQDGSLIAIAMVDNSVKIVKSQNYEIVQHFRGLYIEPENIKIAQNKAKQRATSDMLFYGNKVSPATVQIYDPVLKRVSGSHYSLNRNYVSNSFGRNYGFYKIKDCVFSKTGEELITYEQLNQSSSEEGANSSLNTDINIKVLKFWKVFSDGTFGLECEVPDPHFTTNDSDWIIKSNTHLSTQNKIYTASGDELKVWNKKKGQSFDLLCTLRYKDILQETFVDCGSDYHSISSSIEDGTEDSKSVEKLTAKNSSKGNIKGFQPDFIYNNRTYGLCVVYDNFITIWDERDYSIVLQHKFINEGFVINKVVFDGKGKRIALLTSHGIKVIDIERKEELWTLKFKSIKHIQSNEFKNSHFFITMNSEDDVKGITDTLLVFSFRSNKPLKIVKYPGIDTIKSASYVHLNNMDSPSICIITSKGFMQYVNYLKRGETPAQTRIERIHKENSFISPAITPMVNFGDLDEEIEELQLEKDTRITVQKESMKYNQVEKAANMFYVKAKSNTSNMQNILDEYLNSTLGKMGESVDIFKEITDGSQDVAMETGEGEDKKEQEVETLNIDYEKLQSQFDDILNRVLNKA